MMKGERVWVLMSGEKHEGGKVLGIFTDRQDALGATAEVPAYGGPWLLRMGSANGDASWGSGCDWMSINEWQIR